MDDAFKIEEEWRRLIDYPRGDTSDNPLFYAIFDAAYRYPTLRALWPFPSHGTLSVYQTAWPRYPAPRPHRLGFIICDGPPFNVYRGVDFGQRIDAAATVEEAVELLAAIVSGPVDPTP